MDTYIRLSSRFYYDGKNKELIDMSTGEVHKEVKDIKKVLEILKDDKEFNRSVERQLRKDFGLPTSLEKYRHKWKDDSWFIKVYRTEMREYKKQIQLSPSAGLVLSYIQDYIEYKTNRVANKKGKSFTNKELIQIIKISENTLINALSELESKYFIIRIGNKRAREIYFNPYLATSGNEIEKEVLKMFEDYDPITPF